MFQGRQDAEVGLHGLEVLHVSVGDVAAERAQHGFGRQFEQGTTGEQARGVESRQQAGGDVAHVAFHAGDLAGEEQVVAGFVL